MWVLTHSKGKQKIDALDNLLPAFKATTLPCQSITGEPLEPSLVPKVAWARRTQKLNNNGSHWKWRRKTHQVTAIRIRLQKYKNKKLENIKEYQVETKQSL